MSSTIAVEELRVGMYIQLDGGWLSHPFPLSNFRIAAPDQIAILRSLGLARVRWVPEKSEPAPRLALVVDAAKAAADAPVAAPSSVQEAAAQRHAQWLKAQREAARRCESQHAEAARAWRAGHDIAAADPRQAGRSAEALAQAILSKMLAADDVAIRLVSGGADRAAAHALNVTLVSMLVGRSLGWSESAMLELGTGALVHDLGKSEIPERFRHPDEDFSSAELKAYREHVVRGQQLAQRMGLGAGVQAVVAQHHESLDGSGFPRRLQAESISAAARVVAIANGYDNLCNPGTRAAASTPHEAAALVFAQGGLRFDAGLLGGFIRTLGVYPAGSLVQLSDERFALVVAVNSSRHLKPVVLAAEAHGAGRSPRDERDLRTELIDLEQAEGLSIRRSLAAAKLPPAVLQALDPRPRVQYYFEPVMRTPAPLGAAA